MIRRGFLAAILGLTFLSKKDANAFSFIEALPSADAPNIAATIHNSTIKTPVDTDEIPITDSATSFSLKKLTLSKLKEYIFGDQKFLPYNFNSVTSPGTYNVNPSGSTNIPIANNGILLVMGVNATNCIQQYSTFLGQVYSRAMNAGVWSSWVNIGAGGGGGLGVGQTWQDLTATMQMNTPYENTTGKPILVRITSTMWGGTHAGYLCPVDVVAPFETDRSSYGITTYELLVPPGGKYQFFHNIGFSKWMELR